MLDDLNSPKGNGDLNGGPEWVPGADRRSDREVPLAAAKRQAAVHAWLDGEIAEDDAMLADTKRVELWRQVNLEASRRRDTRTPAYVEGRIMQSLPAGVPRIQAPADMDMDVPLWRRTVKTTAARALLLASGLVGLGAVLGALMRAR